MIYNINKSRKNLFGPLYHLKKVKDASHKGVPGV